MLSRSSPIGRGSRSAGSTGTPRRLPGDDTLDAEHSPVYNCGGMRGLAVVIVIIGLVALAVGIVYYVVPAHSLPSFLGTITHSDAHRTKRGLYAVVGGAIITLIGIVMVVAGGGRRRVRW